MIHEVMLALLLMTSVVRVSAFRYEGESMNPYLKEGCVIISADVKDISEGDVIIYYDPLFGDIVHRVIGLCDGGYVMKGDNNWASEGCISAGWVVGKMIGKVCL